VKVTENKSGGEERRVLISFITDKHFLARVAPHWAGGMFTSRYANLVAQWCVDYHTKYQKAPAKEVEAIFRSWASEGRDKADVELIESFLSGLSEEYERNGEANTDYMVDVASRHFNSVKVKELEEVLKGFREAGQLDKAMARIGAFNPVGFGANAGVDLYKDRDAFIDVFAEKREPLITWSGALGEFMGRAMARDSFVAFTGAEKKGKSYSLLDVAWQGVSQRRKVIIFEAGDMSQNQVIERLMVRMAGRPMDKGEVKFPREISRDRDSFTATVVFEEREFRHPLNWREAWDAWQQVIKHRIRSNTTTFRLFCHSNISLSVDGIRATLDDLERREDWTPDVVVVDYADILAPMNLRLDPRHQINETWAALRKLSQDRHCLVVTATQASAASYGVETLSEKHFSEDKRKRAHVTGMIGINAEPVEKEMGVVRYNWLAGRDFDYTPRRCVHVAQCRAIAHGSVCSCW
jgi:replicative DNA helicase